MVGSVMAGMLVGIAGLGLTVLLAPVPIDAQTAAKIPRIGMLRLGSPPDPLVEAFRQGLRDLGYVEGQKISIEDRWAEGREDRLPALATELVRLQVDVIVASGNDARVSKRATTTIPIVMPIAGDPIGDGLIASLARPGGNVTGFAFQSEELPQKWVELLRETLPRMARVAVLSHVATGVGQVKVIEAAARSLGLRVLTLKVRRPDDLGTAFTEARKDRADALIILALPFFFAHRARLVELAAQHRLPTMYFQREFVVGSGGLMCYGPNLSDLFRRAATVVDRIPKGAKPADLPIEQPTKFELVINMKTAKALGLTIPPSVLARADEVIQ